MYIEEKSRVCGQYTRQYHPMENSDKILQYYRLIIYNYVDIVVVDMLGNQYFVKEKSSYRCIFKLNTLLFFSNTYQIVLTRV